MKLKCAMKQIPHKRPYILQAIVCLGLTSCQSAAPKVATRALEPNPQLRRLFDEDQRDREPFEQGKSMDWDGLAARDAARRSRVEELYAAGGFETGEDFYHAAMILQHGNKPEDFLLCHEFCVAAVFLDDSKSRKIWSDKAKWLAAASEDRFLLSVSRGQRFGTQFSCPDIGHAPWRLDKMDEGVRDNLRNAYAVPPLASAKAKVAELNANNK